MIKIINGYRSNNKKPLDNEWLFIGLKSTTDIPRLPHLIKINSGGQECLSYINWFYSTRFPSVSSKIGSPKPSDFNPLSCVAASPTTK